MPPFFSLLISGVSDATLTEPSPLSSQFHMNMNKLRLLPVILIAAIFRCSVNPAATAQNVIQATADDSVPLEKAVEQIKQIEDDFAKQMSTFIAVVDAELAAKRISNNVAQLLRELAQAPQLNSYELNMNIPQKSGAVPAGQPDPEGGAQTVRNVSQKNEAIYAASKELAAAFRLQQLRVNNVITAFSKVLRLRLSDAVLGKTKLDDITTLIQSLERIKDTMQLRTFSIGQDNISCKDLIATLKAVKQLAELAGAEKDNFASTFPVAVMALRNSASEGVLFKQNEIKDIVIRYLEPKRKATQEQGAAIEAMLEARKPAQEITAAVEAYAQAIYQFNSLLREGDLSGAGAGFSEVVADFYRRVASALKSLENGEYMEADQSLKGAAETERQLSPSNYGNRNKNVGDSAARAQIIGKVQKELTEKVTKLREQAIADIISRISTLKESADITALISDIEKQSRQLRVNNDGSNSDDLARLSDPLRELQRAWATNNPQTILRLDQQFIMTQREPPAAFKKEIAALRSRILRTLYATTFNAPELNAAPYLDKEPDAAVEVFCDDLVQRGEWRRLLDILQLRTSVVAQRSGQKEDEAIPAIRSYLAGKNSELAEQWADAVLAYKTVLRSTATRAPIQAAAESIKVIAKAHPKAITEAAIREKNDAKVSPPVTPAEKPPTRTPAARPANKGNQ